MDGKYYNNGWFGRHPAIYVKADVFMRRLRRKAAQTLLALPKLKILDIATGTGAQGYEFALLGHTVVGIDLDLTMLRKAQKKKNEIRDLAFLHADATRLPLAANQFDVAVISFAIHDVPGEIGLRVLAEAARAIKPEGMIYVIDYEEPRSTSAAKILYRIALLYESPNFKPFIQAGLASYCLQTDLKMIQKEHLAFGAVQLVRLMKRTVSGAGELLTAGSLK